MLPRLFVGIETNRNTNSEDSSTETNTLATKLIYEKDLRTTSMEQSGDYFFVRAAPFYATDWDLDATVPGINVSGGYVNDVVAIGGFRPLNAPLRFTWQPELTAQYKHVFSDGGNPALAAASDFAKLGESVSLIIRPFTDDWTDRLRLALSYQHTNDFTDHWNGNDLIQAKLSLALDDEENFSISLAYTNGTAPLLEEDTNTLALELTFKR